MIPEKPPSLPRVLQTKITPPRRSPRTLVRKRVQQALQEALHYRLTILQAGAGYGKSTSLAALAESMGPIIWYQVSEDDRDPLVFLLHLCHAIQWALPEIQSLPLPFLETWDGQRGPLPAAGVVDQIINTLARELKQPTLLAIDDAHLAAAMPEIALLLDRLTGLAPERLHLLLAARPPLKLPNLTRWRARGEVLVVDQKTLALTGEEIAALFARHYGYDLTPEEAGDLYTATEGWAIAVQLFWQSLRGTAEGTVEEALARRSGSLMGLFDYLAGEVFNQQPEDVRDFLLVSATLREMTPEACNALRPASDSELYLEHLRRQELFVVEMEGRGESSNRLRYHHIFHNFLRQQVPASKKAVWHRAAAAHFQELDDPDEAIYHYLQADDNTSAASLLDLYGARLIASGRLDTLASYLGTFQPATLQNHPPLLYYLGDLARLHSRFSEALGWYQQAEGVWRERGKGTDVARALRGQARVYLDTVNATRAEELLEQSIRLTDGIESRATQARLYELLAENKLNAGQIDEAERLRHQAESLRVEGPSDSQLLLRVLLRTGRLEEARQRLEAQAANERQAPIHTPRAHRETQLLLSLVYAFLGEGDAANRAAIEGTQRGIQLQSPFVTAVGHIRQGHARMLFQGPDRFSQARQAYLQAKELSLQLEVPRLLVEINWGLCRAFGYQGDLAQARQVAEEGIKLANQAGDEWVASLTRLAMGASLTIARTRNPQTELATGLPWLEQAAKGFQECSDPFGNSVAQLWLCLHWWRQASHDPVSQAQLAHTLPQVLKACRTNGYDFIFTRPTLLGPPDERMLVPLLILARDQGWETGFANRILSSLGLPDVSSHPGYQLRVYSLGKFEVWRGSQRIPAGGWRREKARQLFQLLLTHREVGLEREQIIEFLWPNREPAATQRNFKVALNTLYAVLEPERNPGSDSAFVRRRGSNYTLRANADIWFDVGQFNTLIQQAERLPEAQTSVRMKTLENALTFYHGEYLPDVRYETWPAALRENLAVKFLQAADHLVELYLDSGRYEEAIPVCQRILNSDNCWERAYRYLMHSYAALGDQGQIARTYQRCVQTLYDELEVAPALETKQLFHQLTHTPA